jgi:hypothetical protein
MSSRYKRELIIAFVLLSVSPVRDAIGSGYAFTNIADTTMMAPFGANFRFFSFPSLDGETASFSVAAQDVSISGVFSGSGGPITSIAKTGDAAPLGSFTNFRQWLVSSGAGQTAFVAGSTGGSGVYTGNGGAVSTVAKVGDPAPIGTFSLFNDGPDMDNGITVFTAEYNSGGNKGVFTANGSTLTTIAKTGDAAPSGTFNGFSNSVIDGSAVAFTGTFGTKSLGVPFSGVFLSQGGSVTTIMKEGDPAPTSTFDPIPGSPSLSGTTVAFPATYSFHSRAGIFTGSGGPLTTIVKTGDTAPVGVFGSTIVQPSMVGDSIAFRATYGPGEQGLFINKDGQNSVVIKLGDALFGSAVTGLNMSPFGLDRSGTGNLAFLYTLSDGRTGIAIATAVPEPCTSLHELMAMAGSVLVVRSRRRRVCM